MQRLICIMLCFSMAMYGSCAYAAEPSAETGPILVNEVPVEYLGGHPSLTTKDEIEGTLTVTPTQILFKSRKGMFEVNPQHVTGLSGGEFAKRRVKSSIIGAIFLTPLFLFALIGKKKRDILLIEYSDSKLTTPAGETPKLSGAVVLRYKPKGGRAITIENAIESVTNLEIQIDETASNEKETKTKKGEAAE